MKKFYLSLCFWTKATLVSKTFLLLPLAFNLTLLNAQTNTIYFEDWVQSSGSIQSQNQNELLEHIATVTDANDNLIVASSTFNDTTDVYDLLLQKFTDGGSLIWSTQYNISGGGDVLIGDMTLDASGNVIVTGSVLNGSNSYDALTVKYTSGGTVSWQKTWNGAADEYDGGTSVTTDASGNIYITGVSTASFVSRDFLTIKYTSGGFQSWVAQYDHAGYVDVATKLTEDSGVLRVFGGVQINSTTWAIAVVRYYTSYGSQMAANIISSNIVINEINGFTTDASGNTYIVGARNNGSNGYDYLTIKLDSDLTVVWEATWNGTNGKDVAKAVAVDDSANVFVTGYTATDTNGYNYMTLKYNSSGALQWEEAYDGAAALDDQATDVEVDGEGNVFVTGFANEEGTDDFVTLWYDTDGDELWRGRFNSVYNRKDRAAVLQLDGDDAFYVTGRTVKVDAALDETVETTTVRYRKTELIIPPDEEELSSAIYFIKNNGQLFDMDYDPIPNAKFYSLSVYPNLYFNDNYVSMVLSSIDNDTSTVDTLHRVDMSFGDKLDGHVMGWGAREDYLNFRLWTLFYHQPTGCREK